MPNPIEAEDLSIAYPDRPAAVLQGLNLCIRPGEFVVIAGPSGSGKSTLCRALIGLIPNLTKGEITAGQLRVAGQITRGLPVHALTQHIAMVFQDPETNIFALIVLDELAFGPENMGLDRAEIVRRVETASDWVGIRHLWAQRTDQLSGGQKQRVAIAGALAMQPQILVLDEPTTDLDPAGKQQVVATLTRLKQQTGLTLIVVEHDLSNLVAVANRLVVMGRQGQIVCEGAPAALLETNYAAIRAQGIRIPTFVEAGLVLRRLKPSSGPLPLDQRSAVDLLTASAPEAARVAQALPLTWPPALDPAAPPAVRMCAVSCHFTRRNPILEGVNLEIGRSAIAAVIGPNGAGKSTLLKLIVGLLKPRAGTVQVWDRQQRPVPPSRRTDSVAFVFQDPAHQLFESTVWDEVAFGLRVRGQPQPALGRRVAEILERVHLLALKDRHPATLSQGEQRRLAVATALSYPIDLLLLDEPTTGQDRHTLEGLFEILQQLNHEQGTTIVFVTHDMSTVWRYASQVIGVHDRAVLCSGPTRQILHPANTPMLRRLECELPFEAVLANLLDAYPGAQPASGAQAGLHHVAD